MVAARQRDSDYKEKIRQVAFNLQTITPLFLSIFPQAGQMLRGAGGSKEAAVSERSGRQPEEVSA